MNNYLRQLSKIRSKFRNSHSFFIFGILIISLLVMIPMFIEPYHAGDDTKFHIANVLAIQDQILYGKIPPSPILAKIGYGLGYGTTLFYPPLAHTVTAYISAGLHFFGFDVLFSFKIVHFLVLFLSGISMYFFAYQFSKRKKLAFVSAILYMTFPYHISDIYVRDALAECFLFIFIPMIMQGVYCLLEGNTSRFYPLFVLGYVGGILSHFTMMIYFTILLAIFLMISRDKVFTKKFLIPFGLSCISVIGISSFFLSSLIQNRFIGDYVVFHSDMMAKRIVTSALFPFEYFNVIPSLQGDIKHYFPIIFLVLLGFTFYFRKKITFPHYTKNFVWIGIIVFLVSTNIFPWIWSPSFFRMIQFPWRLEVFVGFIVSLLAPFCLLLFPKKKWLILLIPIFILCAYQAITFSSDELIDIHDVWYNGGMGWQKEYLPLSAKINKKYISRKGQNISFLKGSGTYQITNNRVPQLAFDLKLKEKVIIELPRIYYPGYQLLDPDGKNVLLTESSYGLLQAEITQSGNYMLDYTGTLFTNVCEYISIFIMIVNVIGYFIYIYRKHEFIHVKKMGESSI